MIHAATRPYALAAAVFVAATACYVATLAPTVTFVDSGELIAAANSLGVAHPPGFPLYTLIAHLATLLPVGSVAERVNLVSAVFAGIAAAAVGLLVLEIVRRQMPTSGRDEVVWVGAAAALSGGLLFAFSRTLWSYATVAEVYSLNIALVMVAALLLLRWGTGAGNGLLLGAAALFGLALGVHHVTVALTLPAALWLVFRARGAHFLASRTVLAAVLVALGATAISYSYLPLAASRQVGLNWGDPQTLERFWWHVSGSQYQAFFDFSPAQLGNSLADQARFLLRQFGPASPVALAAAAAGTVWLFLRDRTVFWFLVLAVVPNLGFALVYPISEDRDAYLLPTFAVLSLAAGLGIYGLVSVPGLSRRVAAAAVAAFALLPAVAFVANLPFENRRDYFAARDYVDAMLDTVGSNGLVITYDWEVYAPLLYVQEVEQRRGDVVAIDANLLRRSWYFDYLERRYPALIAGAREPVDLYLDDLRAWERNHALYEQPDLNQRIDARFQAVIAAFVRIALASGPVYATQDIALEGEMTALLAREYSFVPDGLLLQLWQDRDFHEPAAAEVRLRGLTEDPVMLEPDDVARQTVLPAVLRALELRGLYYEAYGRVEPAREAFAEAEQFRSRFGL